MKVILNTTFFFAPNIAAQVRHHLRTQWVPACKKAGADSPLCLALEPEPGIERLAVQANFADRNAADTFLNNIAHPLGTQLTNLFGAEAFTCFSTIMDLIDL